MERVTSETTYYACLALFESLRTSNSALFGNAITHSSMTMLTAGLSGKKIELCVLIVLENPHWKHVKFSSLAFIVTESLYTVSGV